jgi:hypothetical protein
VFGCVARETESNTSCSALVREGRSGRPVGIPLLSITAANGNGFPLYEQKAADRKSIIFVCIKIIVCMYMCMYLCMHSHAGNAFLETIPLTESVLWGAIFIL